MSINLNAFFEADRCTRCDRPHLAIELRAGLCFDCRATEARARAVIEDTARGDFDHDPADDCGCDRCVLTRAELNERYDALSAEIDDGVWLCLAGDGPENSAVDSGEAA